MRILNLFTLIFTIAIVVLAVGSVIMSVVSVVREKKRTKQEAIDHQVNYDNHAPHRAWATKIEAIHAGPKQYNIAQIEPPPEIIGGEDWRFDAALKKYNLAVKQVSEASEGFAEAKRTKDPREQRRILYNWQNSFKECLPRSDSKWAIDRILQICKEQADALWEKAKGGDVEALSELIAFTVGNDSVSNNFHYYTGLRYAVPQGWRELISEHFEAPTLQLLSGWLIDDGELILFAETALRTKSIVKAKIVLAHWRYSIRYQSLIPQNTIVKLGAMVEHYHALHPITETVKV